MTSTHPSRLPDDWQLIRHEPTSHYGADAYTLRPYGAILQGLPDDAACAINSLPGLLVGPKLLAACRMVVERWERGDLAEAARTCSAAIAEAEMAVQRTVTSDPARKPYSVLLLYPDYANDGGNETYYDWVNAPDPIAAIAEAQRQALAANEWDDADPADFVPLLVTIGHHYGQPMSND
jgi:hypothetical protein